MQLKVTHTQINNFTTNSPISPICISMDCGRTPESSRDRTCKLSPTQCTSTLLYRALQRANYASASLQLPIRPIRVYIDHMCNHHPVISRQSIPLHYWAVHLNDHSLSPSTLVDDMTTGGEEKVSFPLLRSARSFIWHVEGAHVVQPNYFLSFSWFATYLQKPSWFM